MNRLTLRLKITLAFTLAMAVVLAALGIYIFFETRDQLDESVNDNLEVRAADLAARTPQEGVLDQPLDPEDSFAQIVGPQGEVELTTEQVDGAEPIASSPGVHDIDDVEGIDGRARVLVAPIGDERLAVVGASLEDRDESVQSLALLLALGGPAALLLASLAGYWVAGRALDPLERGYERERRFVDDASHELRTPLALHKAELEVALRYGDDAEALRQAIVSGIAEVDRLAQLADDLLVVARSGEDGLALNREEIDADELFQTIAMRFDARARSEARGISVGAEDGLRFTADRLRLEQAIANLVENALRHGAGQIELSAERSAGGVAIHVRDEGPGFADGFRPHAFERFSREDNARARGGAGLGLAIVEAIAAAHGGRAGIGERADVWIELPDSG